MRIIFMIFLVLYYSEATLPQDPHEFVNTTFLKKLNKDRSYTELKKRIVSEFRGKPAGRWGEFVKGVDEVINTQEKKIAFTFDACGGKKGSGYDKELIEYMQQEKIPATLFISGNWIDSQFDTFLSLSRDTLFEIENHGLNHRPCSIDGESAYGIKGTNNIKEAFDEIEANARKIEAITGRRPRFYRSATAYINEECTLMAERLGITTVSYEVLSGDSVPFTPESEIEKDVLKNVRPGAIVIMHFNHPEWNTYEAMKKTVPILRQNGYTFVKLKDFKLVPIKFKGKKRVDIKKGVQPGSSGSK
jgi:peptidoglycan/xylan/chitin deacetylase (PgdA/CDA1 family)